ncbi:MAG: amino acid ABC transporter substrate-binding protein [Saprospirales bacterium]|nr:MAG: amino acid ABC transporter substrate-binding protein [Saprospirales bacterium]
MSMKYSTAFLLLVLLLSCGKQQSNAPSSNWGEARESGMGILTAIYVPSEGFAYIDEAGKLTGFTVELLRTFSDYILDEYNVELKILFEEETDWRVFYNRIRDGADGKIGMGNVTITDARKEELHFSPPYMNNIAALISHRDAPSLNDISQIEELWQGKTGLAFEGTLHEERVREIVENYISNGSIKMVHTNDEIIELISSSNTYFAYIDLYNYLRAVNRGFPLQHHPAGDVSEETFGYILPLNSTWAEPVRAWFESNGGLMNSPFYRELMIEHLGEELARQGK